MKDQANKTELFETMPIPKAVATMCVPTVLSCLVMALYSLADTLFVGMLNDSIQTSAVTLASPVILSFNAINNLFGIGSSSLLSRSLGSKDDDTAKKVSTFGIYAAGICAAFMSICFVLFKNPLLTLLGVDDSTRLATSNYFFWVAICGAIPAILNVVMGFLVRAEGSAKHASIGMISGCLLNIVLDPLFILPGFANMGAAGAGLATFISNIVAVLYFLIYLRTHKGSTSISLSPKDFKPTKKIVIDVCSVGVPSAIQNLLNVTGQTILNNMAAVFGTVAVSAVGITHKVIMIPVYICLGIGNGITPLIGYNYSSGNRKRMKEVFWFTSKIAITLSICLSLAVFFFSRQLTGVFMKDANIIELGAVLLKLASPTCLFLSIDFLAVGVFQACGLGSYAFIFAVLRKLILEIPLLWIWNKVYPLYGLSLAQPTAELVLAIAALIITKKIFDGKLPVKKDN